MDFWRSNFPNNRLFPTSISSFYSLSRRPTLTRTHTHTQEMSPQTVISQFITNSFKYVFSRIIIRNFHSNLIDWFGPLDDLKMRRDPRQWPSFRKRLSSWHPECISFASIIRRSFIQSDCIDNNRTKRPRNFVPDSRMAFQRNFVMTFRRSRIIVSCAHWNGSNPMKFENRVSRLPLLTRRLYFINCRRQVVAW